MILTALFMLYVVPPLMGFLLLAIPVIPFVLVRLVMSLLGG